MKVKIGVKVYDSKDQPIMIILSEKDKDNIINMHPKATRYACFNNESKEFIDKFMNEI